MTQPCPHPRSNRPLTGACAVAIAAAVLGMAPLWAHEEPTKTSEPQSNSMDHSKMDGMKGMGDMPMTGDVDYDFAAKMRKHHQMAIDMSQAELKNGKDPKMLQMAKDVIAAQKKEIAVLDQWMAAHHKGMTQAVPKSQ